MKRNLLISFVTLVLMIAVMQYQGHSLVTPQSPRGIINLEFARTPEKFNLFLLFWNTANVTTNLYLDFLFIAAYTWFFITACAFIKKRTGWNKWSSTFTSVAVSAACFDALENLLLLLLLFGKFNTSVLQIVFYCALLKFSLVASVILYILFSFPFALMKNNRRPSSPL